MAGNTAMIPEVVRNCRCYYDNKPKNFTGDLTLPVFTRQTADLTGAGIAGTVSVPVRGNLEAMQATYATRVATPDFFATFSAGRHTLEFRGVIQGSDATQSVDMNFACFMGVLARGVTPGNLTKASEMGATAEFEVLDCQVIIDGVTYVNISKLNDIVEIRDVNGDLIDENAEARQFLS
jgi:phage tail tube protein FII